MSANRGLHKAHVQWLEYALLEQARKANRCTFENINTPTAPDLTEAETADVQSFLHEILQILPLVGLRVFEMPAPAATPATRLSSAPAPVSGPAPAVGAADFDTVVVPAQREGFEEVFLGQNCWYAIRISGGALPKIRWIAAYQTKPISKITHYAPVASIEPYGDGTKYKLNFTEPAKELPTQIPPADATSGALRAPRYTSIAALLAAKKVADLF